MNLTLYYHPLASFCWKPLIALYEQATPFVPYLVDLGNTESRENFKKIWPIGEFPVLQDAERNRMVPHSATIIEYLSQNYPGKRTMIPIDADVALEARRWDHFYDYYVHLPMQEIVGDILRPEGSKDPFGVQEARDTFQIAFPVLEKHLTGRTWMVGEEFSVADCSAAPALFYANKVEPFKESHPYLHKYLLRLIERPSFARVLKEAKPYFNLFPYKADMTTHA